MARDPAHRYATASDLAETCGGSSTIGRFEVGGMSARERLARWFRSNPAMAGLSAGIVLAIVLGTAVASYFAIRATRGKPPRWKMPNGPTGRPSTPARRNR